MDENDKKTDPQYQDEYLHSSSETAKQPHKEPEVKNGESFFDKAGKILGKIVESMEKYPVEAEMDKIISKVERFTGPFFKQLFEQALLRAGFTPSCIDGIKQKIKSVNPKKLIAMDRILGKTKEQTPSKGGKEENGNENEQEHE